MNSALSLKNLSIDCLNLQKRKLVTVNALYFCQGPFVLAGSFLYDFVFCQELRLLPSFFTNHMGLVNPGDHQALVVTMRLLN